MSRSREAVALWVSLFLFGVVSSSAWALPQSWVSQVGDDANPCTRTAPCLTWAGAISKTPAGGEINAIESGDHGIVTITKSITIDGGGTLAQFQAFGVTITGIVVDAGVNDVVILRNLSINGFDAARNGIAFVGGGSLYVENVHIFGFAGTGGLTGNGIDFNPSANAKLYMSDSSIRDNNFVGVLVRPTGSGSAKVTLTRVQLEGNTTGLFVSDGATVSVVDSVATGNSGTGFQAASSARPAIIQLEHSISTNNGTYGARTDGPFSQIWLSNSTIMGNFIGLASAGGNIVTFSNNSVGNNSSFDGFPTNTVSQR